MQKQEYQNLYDSDQTHWWYQALNNFVFQEINKLHLPKQAQVLDIGCGAGGLIEFLRSSTTFTYHGVDPSPHVLSFVTQRKINFSQGDFFNFGKFENQKFDLIISTDSFYYLTKDEREFALKRIYDHLNPKGYFFFQVPALSILKGRHDQQVGIRDRFSKSMMNQLLSKDHWSIKFLLYRYAFLFPIVFLKRFSERGSHLAKSDIEPTNPIINRILTSLLFLEDRLPKRIRIFPGSSLAGIVQKR